MRDESASAARQAVRVSGHFGEWMQGRLGPEGPVALVTLCCPVLGVCAPGGDVRLSDLFNEARLTGFAAALGLCGDWPGLSCDMPLGAGAGASTACLVAAARACGFDGTPERLARACLAVEGASDPLMYPAPDRLLWASREARVVAALPPVPRAEIVAGYWGAPVRTDPADCDFPDISDLVARWRGGGELALLGALSSEAARRSDALRGPGDPMTALARDLGALGHTRAYTGAARALIFAPGTVPEGAEAALCEAGLTGGFRFVTGGGA
ncbi:hypothetical protein [Roseovarius autotrophicus]|uniref:hypothetical protein n=1 Tax=Roseovarius autotrophicus TaxID=2824121 RepID=UPI0019DE88B7|nr:hypothetical protein [Roseovarius autotrophicus]MBE0452943.1 hypothetical protein [Roseovarius sp.]